MKRSSFKDVPTIHLALPYIEAAVNRAETGTKILRLTKEVKPAATIPAVAGVNSGTIKIVSHDFIAISGTTQRHYKVKDDGLTGTLGLNSTLERTILMGMILRLHPARI